MTLILIVLIYMNILKISTAILINVILEFIFTYLLARGIITNNLFTVQHEDYIFIAELMTFFIVKAIENIR